MNAAPLVAIDPAHEGFADLRPLEQALAGVRVVLLGEATRGDGSAFLAKARIVRFLHEELGFDVLAFECGVYDCARAWERIRAGGDAGEALRGALFPFYTEAAQVAPLIELVARRAGSERPLEVAGFDSQIAGRLGATGLFADLRRELGRLGADPAEVAGLVDVERIVSEVARDAYATGEARPPGERVRRAFAETLSSLRERLVAGSDAEAGFWLRVLDGLEASAEQAWALGIYRPGTPIDPKIQNLRSRQMAENLLWLVRERHAARRLVVWSTSIHLARETGRLETGDPELRERLGELSVMGDLLARELGEEVYTLAVTAALGHKGTVFGKPVALLTPTPGSFEDLMARTGLEAAFVDLRELPRRARGGWLARPLIARPLSYVELRAAWPRHVDGLLFLRTMEPAVRIER